MNNMSKHLNDAEIEATVRQYSNMLFKLCFTVLGNNADAEDAVSETIIRYMTKSPEFKDDEYKKAWLLKVAGNICKDMCRFRSRRNHLNIDDLRDVCASENGDDLNLLEEIMQLPYKYKLIMHLHYIEGYSTSQAAKILSVSETAARKRLQYARAMLKKRLERSNLL